MKNMRFARTVGGSRCQRYRVIVFLTSPSEAKCVQVRPSVSKWSQSSLLNPTSPRWGQVSPSEAKCVQLRPGSDCLRRLPTLMGSYRELIRIWRILSQMRVDLRRIWFLPLRIPWATWAAEEYPAHPRLSVMMRESNWFSPSFWFDSDLIQFESSPSQWVQTQLVIWFAFDTPPFGYPAGPHILVWLGASQGGGFVRGRGAKINGRVGCEHDVDAAKECLAARTLEKKT